MTYAAEISRANPMCFLFLIDQSASMDCPFGADPSKMKSHGVADAMNRLLHTLVYRCSRGEVVLDRYYVSVIGYGDRVGPALGGGLAGRDLVSISDVANNLLRVEERSKKVDDGAGGLVEQKIDMPVWFEPVADGGTPMCEALRAAWQIASSFISRWPTCFPPIVMNLTDGEPTDGDPEPLASSLRDLHSEDGNVLFFNLHISEENCQPIHFPDSESNLPDDPARRLFRMSSVFPPEMAKAARHEGFNVGQEARGFVFNANLVSVIQFLDIGTRVDRTQR